MKVYKNVPGNNCIHNLTQLVLPRFIHLILNLGLNFCIPINFQKRDFIPDFKEALRKISWITFFQNQGEKKILSNFDNFIISSRKRIHYIKKSCEMQKIMFPNEYLLSELSRKIYRNSTRTEFLLAEVLYNFQYFIKSNNLIIKNADKNAGICIMYKIDYDEEIFRQLSNADVYCPSTKSHFEFKVEEFIDKVKCMHVKLSDKYKLEDLIIREFKPANFYILPKIHKKFI